MYVVPFNSLKRILGEDTDSLTDINGAVRVVRVPLSLFCKLLSEVILRQEFDEDEYLAANPDVASAVRRGDIESGRIHYATSGYFEGRENPRERVDELWYRRTNPDVARSIVMGIFPSAKVHFEAYGVQEGRAPQPRAVADMELWSGLFREAAADLSTAQDGAHHAETVGSEGVVIGQIAGGEENQNQTTATGSRRVRQPLNHAGISGASNS